MSVQHVINSRQSTVTDVLGEILGVAKDLILQYILYINPLVNPVAWISEVDSVWSRAHDKIVDARNSELSLKSIDIVR